jgi:hypothetical protein
VATHELNYSAIYLRPLLAVCRSEPSSHNSSNYCHPASGWEGRGGPAPLPPGAIAPYLLTSPDAGWQCSTRAITGALTHLISPYSRRHNFNTCVDIDVGIIADRNSSRRLAGTRNAMRSNGLKPSQRVVGRVLKIGGTRRRAVRIMAGTSWRSRSRKGSQGCQVSADLGTREDLTPRSAYRKVQVQLRAGVVRIGSRSALVNRHSPSRFASLRYHLMHCPIF